MDPGPEHSPASPAKNPWLPALLLFLAALLTFLPAVKNDFLNYDDPEYVTANVHVQNGLTWDSLKWAFAAHGANWHPVTCLSHILDGQIFGLRPWGHHLGNVLLHAANTLLVFLLFIRLTRREWPAFFLALLFGLHPLRVESVAWVSERKDVLSAFFFLLTLLAYVQYVATSKIPGAKSKLYYAFALVLFALGLMSKSMLVTTPCVLLLLDFWPLARFDQINASRLVFEKIPFFLLTAAFSVIAYIAQAHGSAMTTGLPWHVRIGNALVCYCRYLGKILWPAGLSPIYPFSTELSLATVLAAAVFLAIVSLPLVALRRKQPALFVGWFWFLGMLVPVIGLVKIGEQSMADRYTYLPSLGITIMLVWGVRVVIKNSRPAAIAFSAAGVALAAVCVFLTQRQITYWRNTEAMFQRAVDTTENNTLADVGLGICLADRGQLDDAIRLYRHSLKASPSYFESHYNLGLALSQQGKFDEAIAEFNAAVKTRPDDPSGHISLGVTLAKTGHRDDALVQFEAAAHFDPSNPLPHDNIAKLLSSDEGRLDDAIHEFQVALELQPNDAARHSNLSALLMRKGRYPEAIIQLQEAVKLNPADADTYNNLGTAFGLTGQLDNAIVQFQNAVRLNPNHTQAQKNLARALAMKQSPPPK